MELIDRNSFESWKVIPRGIVGLISLDQYLPSFLFTYFFHAGISISVLFFFSEFLVGFGGRDTSDTSMTLLLMFLF